MMAGIALIAAAAVLILGGAAVIDYLFIRLFTKRDSDEYRQGDKTE